MASELSTDAPFDEHCHPDGSPRPLYASILAALEAAGLDALNEAVAAHLGAARVAFGDEPFAVDPVPRLLASGEWEPLARGLAQRARALNAFLRDAYGERRAVAAGVLPAEVIEQAEGYEPELADRLPPGAPPAAIIGFDLVRDGRGRFLVVEDNLRTPSGLAYWLAARTALQATLPPGLPDPRPIDQALLELLAGVLRAAAPADRPEEEPRVVLLTDGPGNVAHYEHAQLAQRLGIALMTPAELHRDPDGSLVMRGSDGRPARVDVVYRRTDEDRLRDEHGRMTPVGEVLGPPWLTGRIGLVNAFGNGLADDKLVHGYVEELIRFYLNEEPLVASVPAVALDTPQDVEEAIGRLRELVVKPRHGHGGSGVVIGAQADDAQLQRLAADLRAHPARYVAQPIVALSRHPTVVDGRLQPRHVDLRPFAFCADDVRLAPGGLSRVAFGDGELVVNSSRDGGGKDTWVID